MKRTIDVLKEHPYGEPGGWKRQAQAEMEDWSWKQYSYMIAIKARSQMARRQMTQKQLDIMRAAFAKGKLKWVISTLVFRQGVSFDNLRILVRADGATSRIMGIQIPGRLARLHEGKEYGYLVDVDDTGCAWTQRRALCREQLYEEQKWTKITPQDIVHDFAGQAANDIIGKTQTNNTSTT